jgi:hypothetical protein
MYYVMEHTSEKYKLLKDLLAQKKEQLVSLEEGYRKYTHIKDGIQNTHREYLDCLSPKIDITTDNRVSLLNEKFENYSNLMETLGTEWEQSVLEEKGTLYSEIDTYETQLSSIRQLILLSINDTIDINKINKMTCPVCFNQEVSVCLVPCGHTLCQECVSQIVNHRCCSCRSFFTSTVQMYFSS